MDYELKILLEQPTPKEGAKKLFPDTNNLGKIKDKVSDDNDLGDGLGLGRLLGNMKNNSKFSLSDNFSKTTSDPELKSSLEDAKNDAGSKSKWLGIYNDPDTNETYLSLAGRKMGGKENLYFKVEKQGDKWGWIDIEDNNKWKPFEEY